MWKLGLLDDDDRVGLGSLQDVVKCIDGVAQPIGPFGRLRIGLGSDHQILVGNADIDRPIDSCKVQQRS
jgi:hypothetical protein